MAALCEVCVGCVPATTMTARAAYRVRVKKVSCQARSVEKVLFAVVDPGRAFQRLTLCERIDAGASPRSSAIQVVKPSSNERNGGAATGGAACQRPR